MIHKWEVTIPELTGEERRRDHALVYDLQDTKYRKEYPLIDWGWEREDCLAAIRDAGLPPPANPPAFSARR